ncbi:acetyl-CoA synthetase-like protein [Xylariaceae sp. FL1019]|nr:acetyl-CoA synthetase-like protein [Xylariaceae sp. FL1019]
MTTTVEKQANGQFLYKPARVAEVPNIDLMTMLFESGPCRVPVDTIIHADADEPSNNLNKEKLLRQSKKAAHVLRNVYGIGANGPDKDVVFNISTGHFMLPVLFYGTIAAGGIFSSTSPTATADEVAYQLRQTEAKVVVCRPETKVTALAAARKVDFAPRNVLIFDEADTGAKVPISNQELDWRRITDQTELEDSIICLLFSSGTTGLPKAMRLSHRNSVAAASLVLEPFEHIAATRPPSFRSITLAHLPAAHIAGVQSYFVNQLYMGGTCYWMPQFDFPKFCQHAKKYAVTSMFTVPPIFLLIAKSPIVKDHFDTWEDALAGAAPMGQELQVAAGKKLGKGKTALRQTFGLSETVCSITATPSDLAHTAPAGSVGCLVASCYARMSDIFPHDSVDDNGKDVEPGEEGEMWVKGPVNDKANQDAFHDGWFRTGDICVFRDGVFFIVDRKKELIKYKGSQVAPAELEAILLSHPHVLDAAVIGIPGEGTEVPRAYVVADQEKVSANGLIEWFSKQGLSSSKKLRGGVVFLDAIPKSPSGKILRRDLREMVKKEFKTSKI